MPMSRPPSPPPDPERRFDRPRLDAAYPARETGSATGRAAERSSGQEAADAWVVLLEETPAGATACTTWEDASSHPAATTQTPQQSSNPTSQGGCGTGRPIRGGKNKGYRLVVPPVVAPRVADLDFPAAEAVDTDRTRSNLRMARRSTESLRSTDTRNGIRQPCPIAWGRGVATRVGRPRGQRRGR